MQHWMEGQMDIFWQEIGKNYKCNYLPVYYNISGCLSYTFCNFICNKQTRNVHLESKSQIQITELHVQLVTACETSDKMQPAPITMAG